MLLCKIGLLAEFFDPYDAVIFVRSIIIIP